MKKISNKKLIKEYFVKYNIEDLFDSAIINYAQLHFYEKEEFILESEAELEYYYLLVDGKIKVTYLFENGKSALLKFYKDFSTVGDLELLNKMPIRCNVEAIEDTYMLAIPSNILRRNYIDNVNFLHHLVQSLSEKLTSTIDNSTYNLVYPLVNRLCSYLLKQKNDNNYVLLNTSFKEIAQFLGTSYRHLNRTFKDLEAKGVLSCQGKRIHILKKEELEALAKNM